MHRSIVSILQPFIPFAVILTTVLASTAKAQEYYHFSSSTQDQTDSANVESAELGTANQANEDFPAQTSEFALSDEEAAVEAKKQAAAAKKKAADLKKKISSAHKLTFFDNDFSYLCDPDYSGWQLGDNLKLMALPCGAHLSIGGQYRSRGQSERNMFGLGLTGVDNDFLLDRTRIYGDLHLTKNLRVYGEYIDALSSYENFGPRPIDENRSDMLNLFVEARLYSGTQGDLSARVGRQELVFGAERLVSNLDWANTRRTFEGYRMTLKREKFTVDGFWTNPMRKSTTEFDAPNRDQEFMGIYTSYKGARNQTVDTYFLRYLNDSGSNNFRFNTIGTRYTGNRGPILFDFEGAYQFGQNTDGSDHSAGMMTMGLGHEFKELCWKPKLWAYYDYASGSDNLGAGNGFHHNFPLGHKYMGFMDLFGRRNIEDINFQYTVHPTKKLMFLAWYHYFLLATQSDTPYSVVMTPFNAANAPGSTKLGQELDMIAKYKINARQNLLLGYSHFFAGDYYSTTPGVPFTGDADFFYTQWTINF